MSKINFKKAVSGNLDLIETIYNEAIDWLDSQNIHQWKKGVYPTRGSALAALQDDCLYCCLMDEKIVGAFIINEFQPSQYMTLNWKYNYGRALVLHALVVRPCQTGQGIGRAIVNHVIEQARKNKYSSIRLDAFPDNSAAVSLYRSFGFEFVGKVFFDIKEPSYEWYDCYERIIKD